MSCDIEAVRPGGPVYRLARGPDPFAWPDWAYAQPDGTFGNRWDDPRGEYRVLYASSRLGAFVETLGRFRADPALVDALAEIEGEADADVMGAGQVPAEWIADRVIGSCKVEGEFGAVGHSRSLAFLWRELASVARAHGIGALDGSAIRLHAPRGFTQEVSRSVFGCQDHGATQFAGIAYLSRLGDDLRNWAIFEQPDGGPLLEDTHSAPIAADDEDLTVALERHSLALVD